MLTTVFVSDMDRAVNAIVAAVRELRPQLQRRFDLSTSPEPSR